MARGNFSALLAGNDPDPQTASTVEIPLRIVRKVDMSQMQSQLDAQLKAMPPNPYIQSSEAGPTPPPAVRQSL